MAWQDSPLDQQTPEPTPKIGQRKRTIYVMPQSQSSATDSHKRKEVIIDMTRKDGPVYTNMAEVFDRQSAALDEDDAVETFPLVKKLKSRLFVLGFLYLVVSFHLLLHSFCTHTHSLAHYLSLSLYTFQTVK